MCVCVWCEAVGPVVCYGVLVVRMEEGLHGIECWGWGVTGH